MSKTIYVLHERGTVSHFLALEQYALQENISIKYREFSITRFILKSIIRLDYRLFVKQITNIIFLLSLILSSNKKVIIGIAPLDWRMLFLRRFLKGHSVYYFTSWTNWTGDYFPKKKIGSSSLLKKDWRIFLEQDIEGIFSVTNTGLKSLTTNFKINAKTSVVYHSYKSFKNTEVIKRESNKIKLIYVGRLVKEKGIQELLELITKLDAFKYSLTIVGEGELSPVVEAKSRELDNLDFKGFVSSKKELCKLYQSHDVQILFSRKSNRWEELFGMVIIEAMANNVITISTDHSGPKEIIDHNDNGFIISDDENVVKNTVDILENKLEDLAILKQSAKIKAKQYSAEEISLKWKNILNE